MFCDNNNPMNLEEIEEYVVNLLNKCSPLDWEPLNNSDVGIKPYLDLQINHHLGICYDDDNKKNG